jgi:hypothetical protein
MKELAAWQNFYVIVGSSAGALIGLQFVVMSLIASTPNVRVDPAAGAAYATPTVIHFGTALALAAVLCAPWEWSGAPVSICGLVGLIGTIYIVVITRRMRKQSAYKPEFEDWLFHVLLPLAAYVALGASAYVARMDLKQSLFAVASAALLLLFIGIHNAWDAVTYHIYMHRSKRDS